jgi:hypothetical protein
MARFSAGAGGLGTKDTRRAILALDFGGCKSVVRFGDCLPRSFPEESPWEPGCSEPERSRQGG